MIHADLHIHTLATAWDENFEFNLEQLKRHISNCELNAIAVTNHNVFDRSQFDSIRDELADTCFVLPGIEVSALKTHVLVIDDPDNLSRHEASCKQVETKLAGNTEASLTLEEFEDCFPHLDEYIVVPHYQKDPCITQESISLLGSRITALETSSTNKAIRLAKQGELSYQAVSFTDYRFGSDNDFEKSSQYHPGSVYLATDSSSFGAIRHGLKTGVRYAKDGSTNLEFSPGLTLVQGVNLLLGKRSSGKSFSLDRIQSVCDDKDVYYIKQGELVEKGTEDTFYQELNRRFSRIRRDYLSKWDDLLIKAKANGTKADRLSSIKDYLKSLKSYAETSSKQDCYSSCVLYTSEDMTTPNKKDTCKLINAVVTLLKSEDNADLIESTIGRERLIALLKSLVRRAKHERIEQEQVRLTNKIVHAARQKLKVSAVDEYPQPILEKVFEEELFFRKASSLLDRCWKPKKIADDNFSAYSKYAIVANRRKFTSANEIKSALGKTSTSLAQITKKEAADYLDTLLSIPEDVDLSQGLFSVEVGMIDSKGAKLSGGQRTECVFLGKLHEAYGSSIVLIDEPESSFDNPFLSKSIASKIRDLASNAAVVVATHNQVLGFDLNPEKVFITKYDEVTKQYLMLCGSPHDKALCNGSQEIKTAESMLEILEAGVLSYENRKDYYSELGK